MITFVRFSESDRRIYRRYLQARAATVTLLFQQVDSVPGYEQERSVVGEEEAKPTF